MLRIRLFTLKAINAVSFAHTLFISGVARYFKIIRKDEKDCGGLIDLVPRFSGFFTFLMTYGITSCLHALRVKGRECLSFRQQDGYFC